MQNLPCLPISMRSLGNLWSCNLDPQRPLPLAIAYSCRISRVRTRISLPFEHSDERMIMKADMYITQIAHGSIEAKVRIIVADILDIDESVIHSDCRFREDLGADSLDVVNLIIAFSNAFT